MIKLSPYLKFSAVLAFIAISPFRHFAYCAKIYPSAGSTSATFLKIGVGARAVAMGQAFTAVPGDPYSVYWNPAGLAYVEDSQATLTHNDYFQDLKQDFLAYTRPPKEGADKWWQRGGWGFSFNYFYTPKDIERRSGLNESDPLVPLTSPEGFFRAYDTALSAGYGLKVGGASSAGAVLKFIRQTIDDESGQSFAFDLGGLHSFSWLGRDFTAGAAVQNIGPGIKFISKRYDLPLSFRAGLSHRLPGAKALLALDVYKPVDNYPFFALGGEYPAAKNIFLRTGYRYRLNGNELGAFSGFSAGIGFIYSKVSFDYAFAPFGDLGNSHRFSVTARFGKSKELPPVQARPVNEVVPARDEIRGGISDSYEVSARPLTISRRGTEYAVTGESTSGDISRLSFRTLHRAPDEIRISMTRGDLPGSLASRLPPGALLYGAFQLDASAGNISGSLTMDFRVSKEWLKNKGVSPEKISMLYLASSGWQPVRAKPSREDDSFRYFSAALPASSHYAIAGIK